MKIGKTFFVISETGVSGAGFQRWHKGRQPMGALVEGTTLRRDGAPRDRMRGQQAPVCVDYKKEQRAKEIAALETVKAEKESQVESQERRLKNWPRR